MYYNEYDFENFMRRLRIIGLVALLITMPRAIGNVMFWTSGDGDVILKNYVSQSTSSRCAQMKTNPLFGTQMDPENWSAFNYGLYNCYNEENELGSIIVDSHIQSLVDLHVAAAELDLPDIIGAPKGVLDALFGGKKKLSIKSDEKLFGTIYLEIDEYTDVKVFSGFTEITGNELLFTSSDDNNIVKMSADNSYIGNTKGVTHIYAIYITKEGSKIGKVRVKVK